MLDRSTVSWTLHTETQPHIWKEGKGGWRRNPRGSRDHCSGSRWHSTDLKTPPHRGPPTRRWRRRRAKSAVKYSKSLLCDENQPGQMSDWVGQLVDCLIIHQLRFITSTTAVSGGVESKLTYVLQVQKNLFLNAKYHNSSWWCDTGPLEWPHQGQQGGIF